MGWGKIGAMNALLANTIEIEFFVPLTVMGLNFMLIAKKERHRARREERNS
jgi:hypothetical protein